MTTELGLEAPAMVPLEPRRSSRSQMREEMKSCASREMRGLAGKRREVFQVIICRREKVSEMPQAEDG